MGSDVNPMTESALARVDEAPPEIRPQVRSVLQRLSDALSGINPPVPSPPVRLAVLDDESVLVEWIRSDRRLGFVLCADQAESGWYFVCSAAASERLQGGTMEQLQLEPLICEMVR